jgi:outer membrane lipoprotein LolB
MSHFLRYGLLLTLALLNACSTSTVTSTVTSPTTDWKAHQAALHSLDTWQLRGKLAVSTERSADSVNVSWSQTATTTELILSGPIGWGRASIRSDGEQLLLDRNGSQHTVRLDDSAAVQQLLGWPMPVALLPWWIRGLPAPQAAVESMTTDQGRLQTLSQQGWQLDYQSYQQHGDLVLPSKILFQGPQVSGKILVKQWTLGNAP